MDGIPLWLNHFHAMESNDLYLIPRCIITSSIPELKKILAQFQWDFFFFFFLGGGGGGGGGGELLIWYNINIQ